MVTGLGSVLPYAWGTIAAAIIALVPAASGQEVRTKLLIAQIKSTAEINAASSKAFLANNKAAAGVQTTESGLQYRILRLGTGPKPSARDNVTAHYTGTLADGTKFDSSIDRGQPARLPLTGVIKGWSEGLQLMPVGSRFILYVPPELGYGTKAPSKIGPNQVLIFDIELLRMESNTDSGQPLQEERKPDATKRPSAEELAKETKIADGNTEEGKGRIEPNIANNNTGKPDRTGGTNATIVADPTAPALLGSPKATPEEDCRRAMQLLVKGDESGMAPLRSAAERGHLEAQWRLGLFYLVGGTGITKDVREGEQWLQKAAAKGSAEACYGLGDLERQQQYGRQNDEKARLWYQKAADMGYAPGQLVLGFYYANGMGGLEKSWNKAAEMFEKASNQGFPEASFRLSQCYMSGIGVRQDMEKSVRLMDQAASQNHPTAQLWFDAPPQEALQAVEYSAFINTWSALFARRELKYIPKPLTDPNFRGGQAIEQSGRERKTCTLCNGSGFYGREALPNNGTGLTNFRNKTCSKCNGTGILYY